jgi:hypothetical protein
MARSPLACAYISVRPSYDSSSLALRVPPDPTLARAMAGGDDAARASAAADALREGLCVDSDDDAAAAEPPAPPPGATAGGAEPEGGPPTPAEQVEQLKEVIDGLKAALHAERATVRDKDVQIHKLLAERDLVVGARRAGRASAGQRREHRCQGVVCAVQRAAWGACSGWARGRTLAGRSVRRGTERSGPLRSALASAREA